MTDAVERVVNERPGNNVLCGENGDGGEGKGSDDVEVVGKVVD